MKMKIYAILGSLIILFAACKSKNEEESNQNPNVHKVVVKEVIQTSPAYTYLKVEEKGNEFWIAVSKTTVDEGATYYYTDALEMRDFESKDLNKTFKTIFFVQDFMDQPPLDINKLSPSEAHGMIPKPNQKEISVEPAEGGITIATLFSDMESYSGKKVIIKGEVVKVNKNIMDRNWVHIQDGTRDGENFDLTITTNEMAEVGEMLTFEGNITLNKDFGSGYTYTMVMEDGSILERN
ncbi:hypothetical protein ACFL6I_05140 [candidate division KSB1 bacterium]